MNRIKESDYIIFKVISLVINHMESSCLDYNGRVREFYRLITKVDSRKVFYFSDTTMKRIENMDISKLRAEDILSICHKSDNRTGIILASENYRRLCFGYTVSDNQIIICAYRNAKSSRHSSDPIAWVKSQWLGNIIISGEDIEIIPSSLISALKAEPGTVQFDRSDIPILKKMGK